MCPTVSFQYKLDATIVFPGSRFNNFDRLEKYDPFNSVNICKQSIEKTIGVYPKHDEKCIIYWMMNYIAEALLRFILRRLNFAFITEIPRCKISYRMKGRPNLQKILSKRWLYSINMPDFHCSFCCAIFLFHAHLNLSNILDYVVLIWVILCIS